MLNAIGLKAFNWAERMQNRAHLSQKPGWPRGRQTKGVRAEKIPRAEQRKRRISTRSGLDAPRMERRKTFAAMDSR
jgi:hypothetical protein